MVRARSRSGDADPGGRRLAAGGLPSGPGAPRARPGAGRAGSRAPAGAVPGRGGSDAGARLRAAGLRVTRPRRLVLELLQRLGGHRGVDELARALRVRGTPLPRGSVYNVVSALVAAGLVTLTNAGPGRALYELAERRHHHFVCRRCGRILDVPCLAGRRPCLRPAELDVEVEEAQVIFRGRCRACAGQGPRRPRGRRAES